jgi:hypothetical protein
MDIHFSVRIRGEQLPLFQLSGLIGLPTFPAVGSDCHKVLRQLLRVAPRPLNQHANQRFNGVACTDFRTRISDLGNMYGWGISRKRMWHSTVDASGQFRRVYEYWIDPTYLARLCRLDDGFASSVASLADEGCSV